MDAEKLITESLVWINTHQIDLPTAIALGGWLAAKVNKVKALKGHQKQELVCRVVEEVVKRSYPDGTSPGALASRDALLEAVKVALPPALTLAVDAANGRLSLKKVSPSCLSRGLLCFARAAVDVAEAAKVLDAETAKKIESGLDVVAAVAPVSAETPAEGAGASVELPKESEQLPANPESQTPEKTEITGVESDAKPTDEVSQKEEVRVEFP